MTAQFKYTVIQSRRKKSIYLTFSWEGLELNQHVITSGRHTVRNSVDCKRSIHKSFNQNWCRDLISLFPSKTNFVLDNQNENF